MSDTGKWKTRSDIAHIWFSKKISQPMVLKLRLNCVGYCHTWLTQMKVVRGAPAGNSPPGNSSTGNSQPGHDQEILHQEILSSEIPHQGILYMKFCSRKFFYGKFFSHPGHEILI